jgi:hypothetical protein
MIPMDDRQNRPPEDRPPVEQPRFEPEIIPPDRSRNSRTDSWSEGPRVWVYTAKGGPGRFHITVTLILVLLIAGLVVAAALFLVLGTLIIAVPVVVVAVAGALLFGLVRHHWRRLQGR